LQIPPLPIDGTPSPRFGLSLLGGFELTGPDGVVDLPSKKLAGLLAYLACTAPRPQSREKLSALLWGSHFDAQAKQNLRQALSRLRKVLGQDALESDGEVVTLNAAAVLCDVSRFEALILDGSREALSAAANLYRGRLIDEVTVDEEGWNDWLTGERERLLQLALGAMMGLGEQELAAGRAEHALKAGQRVIALNNMREDAHRLIVQALAATGRKAEALKHYKGLVALLKHELNTEPDAATRSLVAELRTTEPPSRSPPVKIAQPTLPQLNRPSIVALPVGNMRRDYEEENVDNSAADGDVALSAVVARSGSPERRQLTIMVCNIVGSVPLSARLDPEDMHDLIAVFHKTVADAVSRFDGFIAQYLGDGAHVYFGYPAAHEHDAEQAVRAGAAILDAIGTLKASSGVTLQASVGIASGLVVVGERPATGNTQQHFAIGEAPNVAAQLQALASPGELVIAASTHRLVGRMFDCRALIAIETNGLPQPVDAWQVRGETAGISRFEARRTGALSPLMGRQEEIELLLRRWGQAEVGEGRVVLLSGEPGIGKSRIAENLLAAREGEPHSRLRYFCSPHHTHSPLYPFIAQLERAASLEPGSSARAKLDKLEALLKPTASNVPRDLALIADLLSVPTDGYYPTLAASPQQKREMTLTALLDQLEGVAEQSPVVIVFEDVHWIDPTSLDLLDRLVARAATMPALLVVTFRSEFQPTWVGQPHVTMLPLSRLGRRDSAGIVSGVAKGKALPDAVVEQVLAHADGVPLFIEELMSTLLESGLLRETADRYVLDGPLPPLAVPTTLRASLVVRLDRLASVKDVAQIGAAIGREFSHELISAVASLNPAGLDAALERLTASGLISRRGTPPIATYAFKHALVQDAAYATMLKSRRRQLHARIAKVMVEQFPVVTETVPEVVAHHFTEAELASEAIAYWLKAGRLASARSANREAVTSFEQALRLLKTQEETRESLEQATDTHFALWHVLQPLNDRARMAEHFREAEVLTRKLGDQSRLTRVLTLQANHWQAAGDYDEAVRFGQEALTVAQAVGDRVSEMVVTMAHGVTYIARGELRDAATLFERIITLQGDLRHDRLKASLIPSARARAYLGDILSQFGRFDEAIGYCETAVQIAEAVEHPVTLYFTMFDLGRVHLRRGNLANATRVLAQCLDLCRTRQISVGIPLVSAALGAAYALAGRADEALPLVAIAVEEFHHRPRHVRPALIPLCAGMACHSAGRIDEAAAHARKALDVARRLGARVSEADALCLTGDVASTRDADDAAGHYREALTLAEGLGMHPLVAHCHLGLGKLYQCTGQQREAEEHLATATQRYHDMGMTHWLEQAVAEIRQPH
jgi:class 3 adenylate cyclase/DNA-binding SARP family transcriptional activator